MHRPALPPDLKITNPILSLLDIQSATTDRIVSIKENGTIDSNFIVTHLIKQILQENGQICLVMFHNTIQHYHSIGKRLGYDFVKLVNERKIRVIQPLNDIVDNISRDDDDNLLIDDNYLIEDKEQIVSRLFLHIKRMIETAKEDEEARLGGGRVYLVIDDISHLLDLGVDLKFILTFVNCCVNLIGTNENVSIVISTHVCNEVDEIISNSISYHSDVMIEVCPLPTGISREVTGIINVKKREGSTPLKQYHYKAFDRGIKTFHPGESLYNLYK